MAAKKKKTSKSSNGMRNGIVALLLSASTVMGSCTSRNGVRDFFPDIGAYEKIGSSYGTAISPVAITIPKEASFGGISLSPISRIDGSLTGLHAGINSDLGLGSVVNGALLNFNSTGTGTINGINASLFSEGGRTVNGASIAVVNSSYDSVKSKDHAFYNNHPDSIDKVNGLQVALVNNVLAGSSCLQLGLWNRVVYPDGTVRSFPLINYTSPSDVKYPTRK